MGTCKYKDNCQGDCGPWCTGLDADSYEGLKPKYRVFKIRNNEPVENCFVLRPDKDEASIAALEAYALNCGNPILAKDIEAWIRDIIAKRNGM